ncbi:MAG: response regulator [Anaerolineaceae bacterium]|nr:response regulator [Anaerolineaceae bacterium]
MIKRILLVDDNPAILSLLIRYLSQLQPNYQLEICHSGVEALSLDQIRPFDLVISDYIMDHLDGLQLARHLKQRQPDVKFILMSGDDKTVMAQKATEAGLSGFISKPFTLETIQEAMNTVWEG